MIADGTDSLLGGRQRLDPPREVLLERPARHAWDATLYNASMRQATSAPGVTIVASPGK